MEVQPGDRVSVRVGAGSAGATVVRVRDDGKVVVRLDEGGRTVVRSPLFLTALKE